MCNRLMFAALVCALSASVLADSVDDFVNREMKRQHIPGASVIVLVGDKVVKIKGYGYANLELGVPAKPDTLFEVGSITKQFTAEAVMMLADQGKIDLDEKISKYLSGTPDIWKDVTVRHLLNHTSGIKNFALLPDFLLKMRDDVTTAQAEALVAERPLDFQPGTQWKYSNSGYFLLGMIVEAVSGEPYAQFLHERIFVPAGMTGATLNNWSTVLKERASGYEWDKDHWRNADYYSMSWSYAAGALVISAADFAKWAQTLFAKKLLKPESYEVLYQPAKLLSGTSYPYGFGWALDPFRGHARIWHNGNLPGFTGEFIRWPQDNLAVAVLTNSGDCNADDLAMGISGLYISALKPFSTMEPREDPDPTFTASLKDLIAHFAKGDANVPSATDDFKKVLASETQKIFDDISTHMRALRFLDVDAPRSSDVKSLYYRVDRDDGIQFLTVSEDKSGKVAGIVADPVRKSP